MLRKKNPPSAVDRPSRGWYPTCIILLCVRLVIFGASAFRSVSKCLSLTFEQLPELRAYCAPSYETVKRWVTRVGYYKLHRSKDQAGDWTVIIDTSIQIGSQKALVIIGCRSAALQFGRAPTLQDFEPLFLSISNRVTSEEIEKALKAVSESVGTIANICSDRGSDVLCGIKKYKIVNPNTRHVSDTAHFVATQLKKSLEKNEHWIAFRNQATQTRRKLQQSAVAGAMPPSPRTKARFMNVGSLIEWARDMLILIDNLAAEVGPRVASDQRLYEELEWLRDYRSKVHHWATLSSISKAARHVIRMEGVHSMVSDSFIDMLCELDISPKELPFIDTITEFLMEQSIGLESGVRFLGTSEPIESMFGKLKALEKEQQGFGFTSLVLAALASVGPLDESTVREAMETTKQSDIDGWYSKEIGESVQKQHRGLKKRISIFVKKLGQKSARFLEGEHVGK